MAFKCFCYRAIRKRCHMPYLQQVSCIVTTHHCIWHIFQLPATQCNNSLSTLVPLKNILRSLVSISSKCKLLPCIADKTSVLSTSFKLNTDQMMAKHRYSSHPSLIAIRTTMNATAQTQFSNFLLVLTVRSENRVQRGRDAHTRQ